MEPSATENWVRENGMYWYQDFFLPQEATAYCIEKAKNFDFDSSDILVSTYPRSGTTWTLELAWLVINDADVAAAAKISRYARGRFIEFDLPRHGKPDVEFLEETAPPRVIKTHMPPQFFERQRKKTGFKTIIVMRNLKDVIVSQYHFIKDLFGFKGTWDEFFEEIFKKEMMVWGDWAKHILKCWELCDDPNVLIMKYEEMKRDQAGAVRKMAEFCEKNLSDEQVRNVVDYSDFGRMKERHKQEDCVKKHPEQTAFFRKGIVGDGEKYFTQEQMEYVEKYLEQYVGHLELSFK